MCPLYKISEAREGKRDSGIYLEGTAKLDTKHLSVSRTKLARSEAARKIALKNSQEFNKAMLTRSWHSIDFKPRKSKSKESLRKDNARLNQLKKVKTQE